MTITKPILMPYPKKLTILGGECVLPNILTYNNIEEYTPEIQKNFNLVLESFEFKITDSNPMINLAIDKSIENEGYKLFIKENKINIAFSSICGFYYSLITIKHLIKQYSGILPNMEIFDKPDLEVRGIMIDISRDKIPTMETLYKTIDLISDVKINNLQLYIEGFSFAYPSFPDLWAGETPFTPEEFRRLDKYAKEHFVDLVPNQNCLGHMTAWLSVDEFKDLAECPEGYDMLGMNNPPGTLNPTDERSLELVNTMIDDLLPNFSSEYFNVDLDEPFELGKGKSKESSGYVGKEQLYIDYANKIYEIVKKKNKKMLMWADMVISSPKALSELPDDITLLDWGYEWCYPFEEHCKVLKESGHDFFLCPGTSTTCSITGKADNMILNIKTAVENAVKYGAKGILLTDWGGMGHWQYDSYSYPGFIYSAGLCWNSEKKDLASTEKYLNQFVFKDTSFKMGKLVYDMCQYYHYEGIQLFHMTLTSVSLQFGIMPKPMYEGMTVAFIKSLIEMAEEILKEDFNIPEYLIENRKDYNYKGLARYLDDLHTRIDDTNMMCSDSEIIVDELKNSLGMIRLGADLIFYLSNQDNADLKEQMSLLITMKNNIENIIKEHKRLWMLRNREGGLERSIGVLVRLKTQIEEVLKA